MKINGKNITDYSAKLIDRVCSTQNIESVTDWLDSSVEGTLLRQDYEFKTMKLSFLVTENDEDAAYKQISRLTEAIKKCSIKFDDINLIFPCVLKGAGLPNRVQNGVFKVDYILLNDWGIGDAVNLSFDIQAPNAKEIKIKYIENWAATAKGYSQCYDNSEIYKTIAEETVYIDKDKVAEVAAAALTWNDFFLALGVDINKYKPQLGTLNGFIDISTEYSESAAVALFDTQSAFDIYYNKYQKKGIADLPLDVDYPSLVWTANDNSDKVSFNLQIGKDWNIQDITIYVWGRWFDSNGKGSMFGALGENDYYGLSLNMPNAEYKTGDINTKVAKVFESSSSGGHNFIIQTLEDIDATPIRKYGFKSSKDGAAPVPGYVDVIFNGVTLDRTTANNVTLTGNLALMNSAKSEFGTYCEIARVQVYHKGKLIEDLIPIAGNVKNGFINTYSQGFYDVNNFKFIPWSKGNGDTGATPPAILPIPSHIPGPEPPAPPAPKFNVTVNNGTGSGQYEEGAYVSITANAAPEGKKFGNWAVDSGNVVITSPESTSTGFTMPAADVTVSAVYVEDVVTPEIFYYANTSDISSETTMGANKRAWALTPSDSGDGPTAYDNFVAVYSVPNSSGQWTIYNSNYYSKQGQGTDKWGRPYIKFEVTTGKSKTGQYITFTPTGGTEVRQNFAVKSV